MSTNSESWGPRWHDELAHLKVQIETFKAQMESGFQELRRQLGAQIAAIEEDIRRLEAQTATALPQSSHASKIEEQIERLRAQGDAAYDMLQATLRQELDPTDVYIKRLEAAAAASPSDEIRNKLLMKIAHMQDERAVEPPYQLPRSDSPSPEG